MLAIRMQRTGRKGHATFRVVVQDSRLTPTSGRVVAQLGSYDPHTKTASIDSDKTTFYLTNGAQPSQRVARLIQKEGITLPNWVTLNAPKSRTTKNPEKLRSMQPKEEVPSSDEVPVSEEPEAPAEEPAKEEAPTTEAPAEATPVEDTTEADTKADK